MDTIKIAQKIKEGVSKLEQVQGRIGSIMNVWHFTKILLEGENGSEKGYSMRLDSLTDERARDVIRVGMEAMLQKLQEYEEAEKENIENLVADLRK